MENCKDQRCYLLLLIESLSVQFPLCTEIGPMCIVDAEIENRCFACKCDNKYEFTKNNLNEQKNKMLDTGNSYQDGIVKSQKTKQSALRNRQIFENTR